MPNPPGVAVDSVALAPGIPPPENKLYYPSLDGLRAIASLLVFVYHYIFVSGLFNGTFSQVFGWGWAGVDLFFVLSGFLITGILYDTREDAHRFKNFYLRRSLRIFPLYYAVLGAVLVSTLWMHWKWEPIWLLYPLYLANYAPFIHPAHPFVDYLSTANGLRIYLGHLWSLSVEEQFYLFWPFLVFAIKDRVRLRNLCLLMVLVVPVLRIVGYFLTPSQILQLGFLYIPTPFRVDALLLGGALALMLRGPEAERLYRAGKPLFYGSSAVLLLSWLAGAMVFHQGVEPNVHTAWVSTIGFSLVDLCGAAVLLLSVQPANLIYRLCMVRPLRQLGKISYGFYVYHFLLLGVVTKVAVTVAGQFSHHRLVMRLVYPELGLVLTVAVSFLSYRFVEAPFLRLKDRFTR